MKREGRISAWKAWFGLRVTVSMVLALALQSCTVGPNYRRPSVATPEAFRGEQETKAASLGDLPWWQIFDDPKLQLLVGTALTNNLDLRIAASRVEQAQALVAITRSDLFPQLNYEAAASRGKNAANGVAIYNHQTTSTFMASASATWEIDLWGRIRRLTESARAQYLATEEARRGVLISLISQVAQSYFQLLALDRQLAIAHQATNSFGESLRIFTERLRGGVASKLETSSAEAAMEAAAATVPEIERQIAVQENQISLLLGRPPGPVERNDDLLGKSPGNVVPAGLPSTLLNRRPDIREAEQQVRSANAQVGVAIADFLPRFTLTGLFGAVSPELAAFTSTGANSWNGAANIAGPLLRFGQLSGYYRQALAGREQAILAYRQAALSAFRDVSDALIYRQKSADSHIHHARAASAYQEAVRIAMERYRMGQAGYYEVLQAQQQLFPAEDSLAQSELDQLLALVQLYRSLGGGWEASVPDHKNSKE